MLYVAGRVFDGSRLYVDLVEVNPPLVVWLALPLIGIARAMAWPEIAVYRVAVWALIGVSLVLCARLLGRMVDPADWLRRAGLLLAVLALLATLPGPFFGQREHLALGLLLPLLFAAAARAQGRDIATIESVGAGLMGAVGIALKPHYVLVALALAAYGFKGRRLPPEQLVIVVVLVGYGCAVVAIAPEYVELVARLGPTYWNYVRRSVGEILTRNLLPLTVLGSLTLWPLTRRLTRYTTLADVFGMATVGLMAAVLLQHKGFGYHYYPAIGTGLLGLLLGAMGGADRAETPLLRIVGKSAAALVGLPCVVFLGLIAWDRAGGSVARVPSGAASRELGTYLQGHGPAGSVLVLSPWMDDAFPLVLEQGLAWGSRYPFMWFVPALRRDELASPGRVDCRSPSPNATAERALIGSVAEDLARHRPELVFVRRPGDVELLRVDLLACLSRNSSFRRELAEYRRRAELEHFVVFERVEGRALRP